jgi:hypothetical protein
MVGIPAWENEYNRPFLVDGERMLTILSDTLNASEAKDNRKVERCIVILPCTSCLILCFQRNRPVTVPSRGTTPQPSTGRATPAPYFENPGVPHSVPNKKMRLGDSNVLGNSSILNGVAYSYNGAHSSSPQKHSTNTPGNHAFSVQKSGSSLPRPIAYSKSKYGHGHPPTVIPSFGRTVSNPGLSIFNGSRSGNRRESFKPRPSIDGMRTNVVSGSDRQWAEFVGRTVKEEDEY